MKKIIGLSLIVCMLLVSLLSFSACVPSCSFTKVTGTYKAISVTLGGTNGQTYTVSEYNNWSQSLKSRWDFLRDATVKITKNEFIQSHDLYGDEYGYSHSYKKILTIIYLTNGDGDILEPCAYVPTSVIIGKQLLCTYTMYDEAVVITYKR